VKNYTKNSKNLQCPLTFFQPGTELGIIVMKRVRISETNLFHTCVVGQVPKRRLAHAQQCGQPRWLSGFEKTKKWKKEKTEVEHNATVTYYNIYIKTKETS